MTPAAPDEQPPPPPPPPPPHGPPRRPRLLARAARWGGELLTVFVGVYAAFLLNNYQSHQHERQRREQILAWMEQHLVESVDDITHQRTHTKQQGDEFNRQVSAGEMPALHAFIFDTDYDPADLASVLGGGGFDLLEVETIHAIKDSEGTLRMMLGTARHDQQLSDALILPNLDRDRSFFYDPATHQLRAPYRWYADFFPTFVSEYDLLLAQTQKALAQIRAERQRNR